MKVKGIKAVRVEDAVTCLLSTGKSLYRSGKRHFWKSEV